MNDPKEIIKDALKLGWSLSGDLSPAKVTFSTGHVAPSHRVYPYIEIEHAPATPSVMPVGSECRRRISIDIWTRASALDNSTIQTAKSNLWLMVEEVRRLIKVNRYALPDISMVWVSDEAPIPDPDISIFRYRLGLTLFHVVDLT